MQKLHKPILILAVALLFGQLFAVAALADDATDTRKAKILANLKLQFPQLEQMNVTMGELKASGYAGLDEGSFMMNGQRSQGFLVTSDDKKLYMIAGEPIDVSRSEEEITAEIAKREEEKSKEAEMRQAELAAAIEGRPVRGNPDAPVTIIEFSDFQCPYCSRGAETVEQILEKYPQDVKFVFQHFPLGFHPWAKPAAIATNCAANQSPEAFWTLHDKYFENQQAINPDNVMAKSKEFLAGSGIDMEQWSNCAEKTDSEEYKAAAAAVDADMQFGQKMGVSGTPGFFVNGRFLNGAQPLANFEPLIAEAKGDAQSE